MKKLSIEEKAKAYDDAKARMSEAYNSNRCTIGFMNEIFPELKESEDERIRKVLIFHFQDDGYLCNKEGNIFNTDIVAWLEKQGEHKPAWSEEDENRFNNLIYLVERSDEDKATKEGFIKFINRLKSLK